ncbi:competence type IV pilus ATPase ComGA [Alteribacillus sp. HJP-4]|uniref:competence type IV pilus ATPase ComGA n=1 Tax=Alteribacillus sp. HJP-4 TaxID=2775394 RepID=UPI0035CCE152
MYNVERESRLLLQRAFNLHTSDIHLQPGTQHYAVWFRIHGSLYKMNEINKKAAERLIAHFKFRAGMDIGEQRRPQSGAFLLNHSSPPVHLRFSTMPTPFKESLSIRILPQEQHLSLSSLSFDQQVSDFLRRIVLYKDGLITLTGATGTGKTTTLYTIVNELAEVYSLRILSAEDPVEMRNPSLIQTEINPKAGITYQEALKASLRHDPDVLLVGEIRDAETARLAVRASLSGHLVLTTMHARTPFGALERFYDFGISKAELKESLLMITSQQLISRLCPFCGPQCSPYCKRFGRNSRLALYDILAGRELAEAITHPDLSEQTLTYTSLQQRCKGMALGWIPYRSCEKASKYA